MIKRIFELARDSWNRFDEHGDMLAAAIAFYSLLSVAPLVVIAVTVAGLVFDPATARGTLVHSLERVTSADVAATFLHLLEAAEKSGSKLAGALALALLLWAASRLFLQIQDALNLIWGVRPTHKESTLRAVARVALKRLVSFLMVFGCAALLLLTLTLNALIDVLERAVDRIEPLHNVTKPFFFAGQELLVPLLLLTPTLAVIYRVLPDARIRWRDVWVGSALTAVLLLLGTALLALFLGKLSPSWLQGAIGAIAVFMIWTYYLAQVFLLGAAFTRVWSHGREPVGIEPEPHAELRPARNDMS